MRYFMINRLFFNFYIKIFGAKADVSNLNYIVGEAKYELFGDGEIESSAFPEFTI